MTTPWGRFKQAARLEEPEQVPVAFIVDSPWLPGYAGIHTLDYFLCPDKWLTINLGLLERFPDAVWIPGFWVEYGMAAEPSAFGARIHFHHDRPPSIEPVISDPTHWAEARLPNVEEDGFMPLVLRLYGQMEERLQAEGLGIRMVAARGPMVTASWVMGVTDLMMGLVEHPAEISRFLDTVTDLIIRWLHAQLETIREPEGIMLLDDLVGMVSSNHFDEFVAPCLKRIFDEFEGLVRVYHNDTPCPHLYPALAETNFDVFNFTYQVDIIEAKASMGHRVAMMGNVPPLHVAVRQPPEVVAEFAGACLDRGAPGGGMILSMGGGVSPGTPAESLDAMLEAARTWEKTTVPRAQSMPDWRELLQRYEIVGADQREKRGSRRQRRRRT
jgi:uroporphyrinogen-III decarboxylase